VGLAKRGRSQLLLGDIIFSAFMAKLFLLHIAAVDRPGLTHGVIGSLVESGARLLDIRQSSLYGHVSLGLLVEVAEESNLMGQVRSMEAELGIQVQVSPVDPRDDHSLVVERTILTVLGRDVPPTALHRITGLLVDQGMAIEKMSRLSLADPAESPRACFEFTLTGEPRDRAVLKHAILSIAEEGEIDLALQTDDLFRRHRRLVVFDMDSTLIQCEVIDELARLAGVYDQVALITERAMQGELDFKASFTKRLSLLAGLPMERVYEFTNRLPLMDGAERLISNLRKLGFKTAICSGGFTLMGRRLQERLGIDFVFANELEEENGVLTGKVSGEIVDGQRKASLMVKLAEDLGLDLRQVIAVGDGANDLPMIEKAGLGIAFRAKPIVRANAKQSISILGLDAILYLIGIGDGDLLGF
jgi:phosphoserine phosphatase